MKLTIDPTLLMLMRAYPEISGVGKKNNSRLYEEIFNEGRSFRRDIARELAALCALHREGSESTQADRATILHGMARTLQRAGFQNLGATSLKPRHVDVLLAKWRKDELSVGTIKNRLTVLRWWADKVGRQNCVPRTNSTDSVSGKPIMRKTPITRALNRSDLSKIESEWVRLSLELQQAFGLRKGESIRFQPNYAICFGDDFIQIKDSWCQVGTPRRIPISNDYQRSVLAASLKLACNGSMISPGKSYKEWLRIYRDQTRVFEFKKLADLRHGYAQTRFEYLTGFKPPIGGGPTWESMTKNQRSSDESARIQICEEMGDTSVASVGLYLDKQELVDTQESPEVLTELPPLEAAPMFLVDGRQGPSELAMEFMVWLRDGLGQRRIKFNEAGAMVHFVEEGMALVSPRIFGVYAREVVRGATAVSELALRVQRELLKCDWHLKAPNNTNIVKYHLYVRGTVVASLACVVLTQLDRFVDVVPSVNAALRAV